MWGKGFMRFRKKQEKGEYHSLSTKLLQVVCSIFCISVLAVSTCNFFTTRSMIQYDTKKNIEQTVQYYTKEVSAWLDVRVEHLRLL